MKSFTILTIGFLACTLGATGVVSSKINGVVHVNLDLGEIEKELRDSIGPRVGRMLQTPEDDPSTEYASIDPKSVSLKDIEITGFDNLTLNNVKGDGDIIKVTIVLAETEPITVNGEVSFSQVSDDLSTKSFSTKVKTSMPFQFNVTLKVSVSNGEYKIVPTQIEQGDDENNQFKTNLKKSDGQWISCDSFLKSIIHRKEYHTCTDLDNYINTRVSSHFGSNVKEAIRNIMSNTHMKVIGNFATVPHV